jgi:hypothetical protein
MRLDLAEELRDAPHYSLVVEGERWRVYVFGVSRLPDSWIVQLALFGSSVRTAVVHVTARLGAEAAAHDAVSLVREWLRRDDCSRHCFLESAELRALARGA